MLCQIIIVEVMKSQKKRVRPATIIAFFSEFIFFFQSLIKYLPINSESIHLTCLSKTLLHLTHSRWQITSRSECSSYCGLGTRTVTSRCVQFVHSLDNRQTRPVPEYICSHLERPKEKEICTGSCHDVRWSYGNWGACSITCGGGMQIRSASCVDSKDRPVLDEKCSSQEKIVTQICGQEICPKWDFGDWTPVGNSSYLDIMSRVLKKSKHSKLKTWFSVFSHLWIRKKTETLLVPVGKSCSSCKLLQWITFRHY